MRRRKLSWLPALSGIAALALSGLPAVAVATPAATPHTAPAPADPAKIDDPAQVLAPGWQSAKDRAVSTIGDANGLNVLVADSASAYQWHTAASLSEPGFDTPQWIGQDCVTGSGNYAAVVYAPWSFSNNTDESEHGAFAAIVNLNTGAVDKLPLSVSLSYYSPGCGTGDQVALSALNADGNTTTTALDVVNAATGALVQQSSVPGQVTSPVPYQGGVAAALGDSVISIGGTGKVTPLAAVGGVALRLHPDSQGGLAFEVPVAGNQVQVRRIANGKSALVGTAGLGQVEVQGSAGRVFLTGPQAAKINLGAHPAGGWASLGGAADATPSSTGALLVTSVTNHVNPEALGATTPAANQDAIAIAATVTGTGKNAAFTVRPAAMIPAQGTSASPALAQFAGPAPKTAHAAVATAAASTDSIVNADDSANPATTTWDPVRGCAVARDDPTIQTFQATAQQVEWATDLAVQGDLTVSRPANWDDSGMPVSWTPQGMFPMQHIDGNGIIPAQVVLGVLAQESNTEQASSHAVDGQTGNFNQGGFYGNPSTSNPAPGTTWSDVDCGYGVGQVTTGMTIGTTTRIADGSPAYTVAQEQQAVATDYATNIAATVNMLIDKWNELYSAGILANGGDSAYIENWWLAAWAYNSGVQPSTAGLGNTSGCTPGPNCTDNGGAGGNWGLGWSNNPADPSYPADRAMFDGQESYDASHPQLWSYPEKVVGWAAYPLARFSYSANQWSPAYAAGVWPSDPVDGQPSKTAFCVSTIDNCNPSSTTAPCTLSNSHCWWHAPITWTTCTSTCGIEHLTYAVGSAEPAAPNVYPADGCNTISTAAGDTLPSNAVVDDGPSGFACGNATPGWKRGGTMSFSFPASEIQSCTSDCITYQGKIDFHQVGAGLNGHMWFTHMINPPNDTTTSYADDSVTATWTPPSSTSGWNRIYVHIPASGANTEQADYQIYTGTGQTQHRVVPQHLLANQWIDIGSFDFGSGAHVSLSNYNTHVAQTDGGDVAFDAVAFAPTAKPTVQYVALGDSYSSGESLQPYLTGSDESFTTPADLSDACHRSSQAYSYGLQMPGSSQTIQAEAAANGAADFAFLACSGAQTVDLTANAVTRGNTWNADWGSTAANYGDYDEVEQVDASGYLDQNTTLVTLSIGGNDARFADIMEGCLETANDCTASNFDLTHTTSTTPPVKTVDPANLTTYEPELLTAEEAHLEAVYTQIHKLAPNARIIVLGYPRLFPVNASSCSSVLWLSGADMDWMNTMSATLDSDIGTAVKTVATANPGLNIQFVDPTATFTGHEVCSSAPWINGVIAYEDSGSGVTSPGVGSFHPMAPGQSAEATLLNGVL